MPPQQKYQGSDQFGHFQSWNQRLWGEWVLDAMLTWRMKGALNRDLETCHSCLGELLDFFTRPFSVTALLLTGANLATALETKSQHQSDLGSMYFVAIPIFLVVAKNFICPYVSLAAAEMLLPGSENSQWHSFAFLYGLIPTSSAPMLVAMRVGKHIEVVAAAVSVGILVAFPMLIASAVLLGSTRIDEARWAKQ